MIPSLQSMTKLGNLMPKSAFKAGIKRVKKLSVFKSCFETARDTPPTLKQQAEPTMPKQIRRNTQTPVTIPSVTFDKASSSGNNAPQKKTLPLKGILKHAQNARVIDDTPSAQTFEALASKYEPFTFLKSPSVRHREAEELHKIIQEKRSESLKTLTSQ